MPRRNFKNSNHMARVARFVRSGTSRTNRQSTNPASHEASHTDSDALLLGSSFSGSVQSSALSFSVRRFSRRLNGPDVIPWAKTEAQMIRLVIGQTCMFPVVFSACNA